MHHMIAVTDECSVAQPRTVELECKDKRRVTDETGELRQAIAATGLIVAYIIISAERLLSNLNSIQVIHGS